MFTGVVDSEGKDIYEGDFFRIDDENNPETQEDFCVIVYLKECACFTCFPSVQYLDYLNDTIIPETLISIDLVMKGRKIIGSIREKKHKRKLTGYIFHPIK